MPDTTNPADGDGSVAGELRSLHDEQRRLGERVDRLAARHHDGHGRTPTEAPPEEEKEEKKKEPPKEPQPKPPMTRRILRWARTHPRWALLVVVLLIVAVVGGYWLWQYLQSFESTDNAQVDGNVHQISSRISGTVVGVYTDNNRSVVERQTLVDLDPSDYITALDQAKANLAQTEAAVLAESPNVPITQTTTATNVTTTSLDVANAEAALEAAQHNQQSAIADLAQAEANATNAAAEEVRYRVLVEREEVAREQYDQRFTQLRTTRAQVESRRAAAGAAAREVDQRLAALDQARARFSETSANQPRQVAAQKSTVATRRANVEAARAQLEQAWLNLSYCKILAPVAGIIGNRTVQVGHHITPGQELLAITDISDLWVTANFKETQIKQIHPGQPVDIFVDALGGRKLTGYVQNMPGATGAVYSLLPPENATGNFVKVVQRLPIRIRFHPGQQGMERLRPGMSVEPRVWVRQWRPKWWRW
jgi:membrane fusion protein (multidrug efflux system)